jgi:hypothetical protein
MPYPRMVIVSLTVILFSFSAIAAVKLIGRKVTNKSTFNVPSEIMFCMLDEHFQFDKVPQPPGRGAAIMPLEVVPCASVFK